MTKFLLILSFLALTLVSLGTRFFAHSPVFWLADPNSFYEKVRLVLSFILILQIASRPPRWGWFRCATGAIAGVVGIWVLSKTFTNAMMTLDSLSILAACIAIIVTSIEGRELPVKTVQRASN